MNIKPITQYFVHWINGMKINRDHFVQSQEATVDHLRDVQATGLSAHRYGLLPYPLNERDSLEYSLFVERPNFVQIEVFQCRAVTPDGQRIEQLDGTERRIQERFTIDSESVGPHLILLSLGSENEAFGQPDPEETPPRKPSVRPSLALSIVKERDFETGPPMPHVLPIARVVNTAGDLVHDEAYIPPSMMVSSHRGLRDFHRTLVENQRTIERHAFNIRGRLNQHETNTDLANSVGFICDRTLAFLSRDLDHLVVAMEHGTPVELLLYCKRFARTLLHAYELQSGTKGKDALLLYVQEVLGITHGAYTSELSAVLDLDYDHRNIQKRLETATAMLTRQAQLFEQWSGLEYIGKKKQTDVFIAEKTIEVEPEPKPEKPEEDNNTGWSFS